MIRIRLYATALVLFLLPIVQTSFADTPTQRFLEKFPLDSIESSIKAQSDGFDTEKYLPFFLQVAEQENENFFGYHATSMAHLIFQEIMKMTFEELYGYHFPTDFYFLRAPDPASYPFHNSEEFINKYSRQPLSMEEMRQFIHLFFLRPLYIESGIDFSIETVQDSTIEEIYQTLLCYAPVLPSTNKSVDEVQRTLKEFVMDLVIQNSIKVEPEILDEALERWFTDPSQDEYRDFESDDDEDFVFAILYPFDDTSNDQQALLTALNVSLFANYSISSESTVHIFAKGASVDLDEDDLRKKAKQFCDLVGVDAEVADEIYSYAEEFLDIKEGVLLQFFDKNKDNHALSDINEAAFVCSNFGVPDLATQASYAVSNFNTLKYVEVDVPAWGHVVLHPQLRLVAIPSTTLNPFSWLEIKEYDLMDPNYKAQLREFIRSKVRVAQTDAQKVESYRLYLESIWGQDEIEAAEGESRRDEKM